MRSGWILVGVLVACSPEAALPLVDAGAAIEDASGAVDALTYVRCSALCLRPSDCAVAYSSGDVCPPGFLCSSTFQCTRDGG